jgi:3-methyladenine DNA glycosylase AlkD
MESTYLTLASKSNFNKALRHFFTVSDVVDDIEATRNLADVVNVALEENEINEDQILPIVGAVIRDKFNYSYDSFNIVSPVTEFQKIADTAIKWTALDIVCVYYTPGGKIVLINPKNIEHWEHVRELHNDQMMVIYAKFLKEENKKLEQSAIKTLEEMIGGKDVFVNKAYIDQTVIHQKPVRRQKPVPAAPLAAAVEPGKPASAVAQAPPAQGVKNITPKYAVEVSNELFHNGNVEAWKKIVESYTVTYPKLKVYIFHEGELINDINSLFKWGKVKHGDSIFFQVAGDSITGVSKLQKYLYEGASPRFEQFLKIGVGQVLRLF